MAERPRSRSKTTKDIDMLPRPPRTFHTPAAPYCAKLWVICSLSSRTLASEQDDEGHQHHVWIYSFLPRDVVSKLTLRASVSSNNNNRICIAPYRRNFRGAEKCICNGEKDMNMRRRQEGRRTWNRFPFSGLAARRRRTSTCWRVLSGLLKRVLLHNVRKFRRSVLSSRVT